MREQKANDNGFPVVGKQAKEQQIFPFEQLVEYDGATNKITINANLTINGDTNIGELDIDSGDAPKGQVLTADGDSGASWENRVEYLNLESESGNLTNAQIEVAEQDNVVIQLNGQFYYKNSQSDESIVFKAPAKVVDDDTIVEKVVVDLSDNTYSYSYEVVAAGNSFEPTYDDELNDSSTNGVQNKAIYAALEEKANVDGYYETFGYARRSGVADNLFNEEGKLLDPNVSESAGTVYADQPFVQRATAMSMNAYLNDELISVASGVEEWKKDEAFSIVRNQLMQNNLSSSQTISGLTITKNADNSLTINGTQNGETLDAWVYGNYGSSQPTLFTVYSGHKYLVAEVALFSGTSQSDVRGNVLGNGLKIVTAQTTQSITGVRLQNTLGSTGTLNNYKMNPILIDLTQWFASRPAIATALSGDNGIKWFLQQYPKALSLEYDEGTIIDTETYEYQTTGVNLWDEEVESGAINYDTGANQVNANTIRSKNFIEVNGGENYYIKIPANTAMILFMYDVNKNYLGRTTGGYLAVGSSQVVSLGLQVKYIKFFMSDAYGTTYKNDIQLCNHFTETQVEQTYHKFEIHEDTVDWSWTSTGKGKSAGPTADTKDYVLGKNIEKVGQVDLGTLIWVATTVDGNACFVSQLNNKKPYTAQVICSKYSYSSRMAVDKTFTTSIGAPNQIFIKDESYNDADLFKAAMSGVILNFALETPIEYDMSGDELVTTVQENDYGNEVKVPASGNMFSGSATTIFYQDNVLRQIYNNKNNIDGLQEDVDGLENVDSQLKNALGGTLRQLLAANNSIDFLNTDVVDLGSLGWNYVSPNRFYTSDLRNLIKVDTGLLKGLTTKYKVDTWANVYAQTNNMTIGIIPSGQASAGYISIVDTSYTDKDTFKASLKGVLLAYEKASE